MACYRVQQISGLISLQLATQEAHQQHKHNVVGAYGKSETRQQ